MIDRSLYQMQETDGKSRMKKKDGLKKSDRSMILQGDLIR